VPKESRLLLTLGNLSNHCALVTPSDIDNKENMEKILGFNKEHQLTHYMVCECNRLRIKPENITHKEDHIRFTVFEQINEFDWKPHEFSMPLFNGTSKMNMNVEGANVILTNQHGKKEWFVNTFIFLEFISRSLGLTEQLNHILKLNIQYIGQTELDEKYCRFKGHEKVVKASSDIIAKKPHKESWLYLLSFNDPFFNVMYIPEVNSSERHDWVPGGGLLEDMPAKQWKTIVEATMINYFKPELNVHYKDNFPSERHDGYKYFYDKNIRSIFVELRAEYMPYVIGNENAGYTHCRIIEYLLSKDDS
jgi:hypothetical protein